ncbi:hypothetical protein, partial [Stenotrophomonas maltophilia]|uniref:hypothetical protein n=2 Tax=Stenotrophomonas maltophilia TaxID=40324 RepID=UPI001FA6E9F2
CKYVHVSSVAASMRLTPLPCLPTRPWTVSCHRRTPREDQEKRQKQKQKQRRLAGGLGFASEATRFCSCL